MATPNYKANINPETAATSVESAVDAGKTAISNAAETAKETASVLTEINQHWLSRTKAEAGELTTLVQNVVGKSPTEAMAMWQEWFSGRVKRASDDAKKLMDDSRALMTTVTKSATSNH